MGHRPPSMAVDGPSTAFPGAARLGVGVVAGYRGADRGDHRRVRRPDAEFPVLVQARGGEVLRADEHLLAGPPRVGDDRLGVDVQGAAAVGERMDVYAGAS